MSLGPRVAEEAHGSGGVAGPNSHSHATAGMNRHFLLTP